MLIIRAFNPKLIRWFWVKFGQDHVFVKKMMKMLPTNQQLSAVCLWISDQNNKYVDYPNTKSLS